MKIKPQVVLALSTVLLSAGVARSQTPPASPPPATPNSTPAPSGATVTPVAPVTPVPQPVGMSPEDVEELVRQSVRENIENSNLVEERVEVAVDREVSRTLGVTNMLFATLLCVLGIAVIGGGVALWFVRRNTIERAIREVDDRTDTLKVELERGITSTLAHPKALGPQGQMTPDSTQLQDVVSMALSVQNIMASARGALEEAVQTQERFGEQLQELTRYQLKDARALMEAGEYSSAIELYDKAIQLNVDDPALLCDRGAALVQLHRYDEASDAYKRATELSPENAEIWYDLARCRALQGSVAQAVANLKQALQLNPQMGEKAKSDADFAIVRENEWFQTTVGDRQS
ncbi:tetratricopeptide repeat protein [Oscillatoriales cyanobacterium LEGE 11467]|uniref:Tetratricopeptide repeat protein n=1 Tax=Zarconia navalis LEGE 11467 TaxID=1828826 RepID=A0A928VU49_9CYAN|nr:tetratricopeptide repeat protein [Zarconia navalis]MBE9039464.1 tetratricopeptide repeat protein [Zarconia navalis LEGE 11467]